MTDYCYGLMAIITQGNNGIYSSTIDVEREYNYLMEDMIYLADEISFKKRN